MKLKGNMAATLRDVAAVIPGVVGEVDAADPQHCATSRKLNYFNMRNMRNIARNIDVAQTRHRVGERNARGVSPFRGNPVLRHLPRDDGARRP